MFPTQRQPLATFTPNTLTQIQNKKTCSTAISFKYVKPVWHESGCSGRVSPSKRPRQSEDICGTKKSKKRLRRLWTMQAASYQCGWSAVDTSADGLCPENAAKDCQLWRWQRAHTCIDVKENQNCRALIYISQYLYLYLCNIIFFSKHAKFATQISIANTVIAHETYKLLE